MSQRNLLKWAASAVFYLFVFSLFWQTKIILRPGDGNFSSISLYASSLLLLLSIILFVPLKLQSGIRSRSIPETWYFLAALDFFINASMFFALDILPAVYHFLNFLLGLALFYLLEQDEFFEREKALGAMFLSLFLQASLGIWQFLNQKTFASKYLGLAWHNPELPGTSVVETASGRWLRAYGGLDHPNILGGVLAVALIIAAYLLVKNKLISDKREAAISLLLFVFYFVGLLALFFTYSRAAWLAYVAGLVVLGINLVIKRDRWIWGRLVALLLFSGALIMIAAFPYRDIALTRVNPITRLEIKSINERQETIAESVGIIKNNWAFGVGPGNYLNSLAYSDSYERNSWDYLPVHNSFLLLLSESGLGALLAFICFLVVMYKKDRFELYRLAVLVVLLILMFFDHWFFSLPFGVTFLFLILGLI